MGNKYKEYIELPTTSQTFTTNGTYDVTENAQAIVNVNTAKPEETFTVTPTTSQQTITPSEGHVFSGGTVNAMPAGTQGDISLTKTVSGHTATINASQTDITGYIAGTTKTNSTTVTAQDVTSGDLSITANASLIDIAEYATVSVNVQSQKPEDTFTVTPKVTSQTVTPLSGHVFSNGTVGPIYTEITTSAGMDAVNIDDNIGKMYYYTGTTDTKYTNGRFYIIGEATMYPITYNLSTGCTGDENNPTGIAENTSSSFTVYENTYYVIDITSETIGVTNATYDGFEQSMNWVKYKFKNPTGPVTAWVIPRELTCPITTSLTHVTADASNPSVNGRATGATLHFSAETGFSLPDTITVTGTTYTWDSTTGTLVLNGSSNDVSITIAGVVGLAGTWVLNVGAETSPSTAHDYSINYTMGDGTTSGTTFSAPFRQSSKANYYYTTYVEESSMGIQLRTYFGYSPTANNYGMHSIMTGAMSSDTYTRWDSAQTITINGGADVNNATLIAWFNANAVKQ